MLIVAFGDIHAPFQDNRAVRLLCQIIEYIKPTMLINLGDWTDFYALSTFDKEPKRVTRLQDELDKALQVGYMINDANVNKVETVALIGNHERRMERYLKKHPELSSLDALTFESLMRLDELGWIKSKDEDRIDLLGNRLRLKHGNFARKHSGYSAKAELENVKFQISIVSGHSHRMGSFYARGPRHLVGGWEAGCLCKLDPLYMKDPDWHQGCVIMELSDNPGIHTFQAHPIVFTGTRPKRARFWGEEFVAK